jgi:copper transport protein
VAVAFVSLAFAGAARAHAVLLATDPERGETLTAAPERVTLTFSENVSLALGAVEAFAPDGERVTAGEARVSGNRVTLPLETHEQGTYAVSWRVLSADGHAVGGAFVFNVGHASANSVGLKKAQAAASTDRALRVSYTAVRFVYLLGILLAAGGAIFAAFVAPGWRPRLLRPMLLVVIAASIVGFFLQTAVAAHVGVLDTFDGSLIRKQAQTVYGNGAIVRIVLASAALAASAVLARPSRRAERAAAAAVFACLALSQSIAGHAIATSPIWARLPLDMLHMLLAAAWLGGLFQLWRYLRGSAVEGTYVVRYSNVAFISVCGLVATGAFAGLAEAGYSLGTLVTTLYGWILLGKLGAFACTVPLAQVNRTRNVPRLVLSPEPLTRQTLAQYVRGEIVILLAVVGLTAWLIETQAPRHARHQAAAPQRIDQIRTLPSGGTVQLVVEPGAVGPNTIAISVQKAGKADVTVDEVTLTARSTEREIEPLELGVRKAGPGRWVGTGAVLPLAGRWRFDIGVRRGEFDLEDASVEARVGSG